MSVLTAPYLVTNDTAPRVHFLDQLATVLVSGEQTDGTYSLLRYSIDKGYGPPRHVHRDEDELFYILSGQMLAECGDKRITVDSGSAAFLPRGLPHAFVVTEGPVDVIQITNPAGFENFMAEVGPMPESGQPDMAHVAEVARRYNIELLGPPMQLPS